MSTKVTKKEEATAPKNGAVATAKKPVKRVSKPTVKPTAKTPQNGVKETASTTEIVDVKKLQEDLLKAQESDKEKTAKIEAMQSELSARKPLNIADALVKIAEGKALAERVEFLRNTRKELSDFSLGSDNIREELVLRDGEGKTFTSHNSNTIKLVLTTLKNELDDMISASETELLKIA